MFVESAEEEEEEEKVQQSAKITQITAVANNRIILANEVGFKKAFPEYKDFVPYS